MMNGRNAIFRSSFIIHSSSFPDMAALTIQQAFELALQHPPSGRLRDAEQIYRQILAQQPAHAGALHHLGVIAHQVGRSEVAVDLIRQAIALQPGYAEAHSNLGNALRSRGQPDEAIAAYRQAITLRPGYAEAHYNLGNALMDKGQRDEAIASYRQAIALGPGYVEAHNNLGYALHGKGQFDEAIAALQQAIAFQPGYVDAHYNLGNALMDNGRLDEAVAAFQQTITLRPGYAEACNNLGNALKDRRQLDEAVGVYRKAIALRPDFAEAHHNLAFVLLQKQDYSQGWREYEWRWKMKDFPSPRRSFSQPQWDGSDLNNRTILLHSEQGFGDAIQFIRYVPLVAKRGGRIIVECPVELQRLFQGEPRGWEIIARGKPLPAFDVHCPLLSLPLVFGTTAQSIPAQVPYLHCDPQLAAKWRERLSGLPESRKVGLVWAGSPAFTYDKARSPRQLSLFSPLAEAENVRFFSLQKGEAAKQAGNPPQGMQLFDWSGDLHDFADTAALIANLDLVISSDTAVAHLAGAMGKPVWVILPFAPDWRWLLERDDCIWYPTMRLLRQAQRGDWDEVLRRLSGALKGFAPTTPRRNG